MDVIHGVMSISTIFFDSLCYKNIVILNNFMHCVYIK